MNQGIKNPQVSPLSSKVRKQVKQTVMGLMMLFAVDYHLNHIRTEIENEHRINTTSAILNKHDIDSLLHAHEYETLRSYFADTMTFDILSEVTTNQILLRNMFYVWLKYGNPRIASSRNLITKYAGKSNNFFGSISIDALNLDLGILIAELAHQPQVIHYAYPLYGYFGVRDNILRSVTGDTGMEYTAHHINEPYIAHEVLDVEFLTQMLCDYETEGMTYDRFVKLYPEYDDIERMLMKYFMTDIDSAVYADILKSTKSIDRFEKIGNTLRDILSHTYNHKIRQNQ